MVGNTVWGCEGYKVNGVTGDDEVGDVKTRYEVTALTLSPPFRPV